MIGHADAARPSSGATKVGLFGASSMGRRALDEARRTPEVEAVCFFDNDPAKWGRRVDGLAVERPTPDALSRVDAVWITSCYASEILAQLRNLGVPARIVLTLGELVGERPNNDAGGRPAREQGEPGTVAPSNPASGTAPLRSALPPPAGGIPEASAEAVPAGARRDRPEVSIVLADEGWILERCARELERRLPYVSIGREPRRDCVVTYYVNYSAFRHRASPIQAAFFTHVETRVPAAARRFFEVARAMDASVAMSRRYADELRGAGASDVRVITPGVDLDRFTPAVRIGVVGRTYHTGRKGEDLVRAVMDEPHIEWHFTGEGWPGPCRRCRDEEMPAFYRSMDYILVPAHYEGGPMPLLEALACGVEVIAPRVGFVDDYPHIEFEVGSAEDLRRVLRELVGIRLARRRAVESRTWDAWAAEHDRLFQELLRRARAEAGARAVRSPSRPRLRVLLALHAPESVAPVGGPSVRLPQMRAALAAHGVDCDIAREEQPDPRGYDLVHVFNVWEPAAARRQLEHLRNSGVPIVFSPILLGLEETLWMQHAMLPAFARPVTDEALRMELALLERTPAEVREACGRSVSTFWREWPARVRELTALADHLIVLSECELERLQRLGALIPSFSLVHNGVEPGWADGVAGDLFARRFGVGDYVLSVGRLEPRKNQLLLARALRDTGITLVLVGDTPKPDYADLVRRHGGPRTHVIGRLDHDDPLLRAAFAGARVFALPSWAEGAPLAALEAAALGIPLVLSDRSGEREYFGALAAYCDPGRVDDIREKVQAAFEGAAQAAEHRAALRQWVVRSLTWDHAARETARAYAAALEAAARRRGAAPPTFTPPGPRRLEIGSGHTPQPGYEHLDARADLPDIDHVCDIRQPLPFPAATFDEVLSRSCIEHVSWREVGRVLAEWARILRPGGRIDLWTPDLEYLCRRYLARRDDRHLDPALAGSAVEALGGCDSSSWAIVKLFGGQDYPENFHGAVLDEEVLSRLLEAAGFVHVERREPFWGLHLVARRAPGFMRAPAGTAPPTRPDPPAPDESTTTLVWDAPLFNTSGYAALSRHVVRALVTSGLSVRVEPRDDDEAMRQSCVESPVEGAVWRRVLRRRGRPGAYVCCYTPADWQGRCLFHRRRIEHPGFQAYVGLTMFETDRLPAGWVEACAAFDEIWVPSRFNLESFARAGVPADRLQVVPVGIDAARYDPARVEPLDLPGRRGFTFLSVFDWSRRKGWDVLLEAYGRAFRASEDVCLVLRTSDRRGRPGSLASVVAAAFDRLGLPSGARPAVLVLEEPLAEDDMPRLYRTADAFVLPTRGEGWGLPLMEAMASGLPVIATRWGAHLDFLTDDTGFLIDVEAVVPVDAEQTERSPYYGADHRWAQPSVGHTAALMRQVYEQPAAARRIGGRAREVIRTSWTPARTAAWIAERVERLAPDAAGLVDRARAAEAGGRLPEAEAFYRGAVSARPGWALARYNLASALERQGKRAEARTLFEAIAADTGNAGLRPGACFHLGRLAFQAGDLDGAARWFERCLAENAGHRNAAAWRALVDGRRHEAAGRLVEALAGYGAACRVDPDWNLAAYNLASVAKRLGDHDRAVELFTRLAREADASSLRGGAHFHLAEMLAETGDREGALARIDSCLIEVPDHEACQALAARLKAAGWGTRAHAHESTPSYREA